MMGIFSPLMMCSRAARIRPSSRISVQGCGSSAQRKQPGFFSRAAAPSPALSASRAVSVFAEMPSLILVAHRLRFNFLTFCRRLNYIRNSAHFSYSALSWCRLSLLLIRRPEGPHTVHDTLFLFDIEVYVLISKDE